MLSILFPFKYRYTSLLRGKHTKASCRPSGNRFFSIYHRTTNYYYNSTINKHLQPKTTYYLVFNYFYSTFIYPSSLIVFSHPLLLHFGFWPRTEPCSATDCHPYTYLLYKSTFLSDSYATIYSTISHLAFYKLPSICLTKSTTPILPCPVVAAAVTVL